MGANERTNKQTNKQTNGRLHYLVEIVVGGSLLPPLMIPVGLVMCTLSLPGALSAQFLITDITN